MAKTLTYTGDLVRKPAEELGIDPYDTSDELKEAVNLAILLKQPLLLMGEPGSGKTKLAEAVAAELHGKKWKEHYFRWDVKSTSKARDGLYQYDALGRLYDASSDDPRAKSAANYITYGQFGKALTEPQNGTIPNILLIDEVDKADIDFPNDLLLEIERREFYISETDEKVTKKSDVLLFITSNRERELPAAFLRRCLYHFINFPRHDQLVSIINNKFSKEEGDTLVNNAVNLFLDLRTRIEGQFSENEKKPATSELIEWFRVIDHYASKGKSTLGERQNAYIDIVKTYEKGSLDKMQIPFRQALLKTLESNQLFETK
jgi:MoxR-like ATPase